LIVDKIRKSDVSEIKKEHKVDIPVGKWIKCERCKEIIYKETVNENYNICPNCGNYFRLSSRRRLEHIIDKDTYNAVQKLLIQRQIKNARKTEITQYPLTGKIRCEECGSYYRRRIVKGAIKWSCAQHLEDKIKCNSYYIDESLIYNAIITIINNLRFNNHDIIEQSIRNLEYATRIIRIKNTDIKNANIEIKDLNAKLLMIEKLRSKGYISQEVYALQANEIRTQISKINNRKRISTKSKIDEALTDIKILNQKLESIPSPLTSFDENLFNNIITSISITKDKILTVTFIGNLQFSEKI